MADVWADLRTAVRQPGLWGALAIAAGVLGLVGPFGTFDKIALLGRMAYWAAVVPATFWLGFVVFLSVATWGEARALPRWVVLALGSVLTSLPVAALLAGLHAVWFGAPLWADALRLLPYVLVITPAVVLLVDATQDEVVPPPTPLPDPSWLDRLPLHLGRDLILLRSEDHYLHVETAHGHAMIRGRLQEASEALEGHGMRIHRSMWVAHRALDRLRRQNGLPVLVLKDGRALHMGRTYVKAVRAALEGAA
ncbi:MAG: LytTR family DNA-binding domain-containing protein [Pseudomonadota bacterium]